MIEPGYMTDDLGRKTVSLANSVCFVHAISLTDWALTDSTFFIPQALIEPYALPS
jgi:hypothetical protein